MTTENSRRAFLSWATGAGMAGAAFGSQGCAAEPDGLGVESPFATVPGAGGTPHFLNITDPEYGGVMDDITAAAANLAALRAALVDAVDRGFAGVLIPTGTLYISTTDFLPISGLAILGAGMDATAIKVLTPGGDSLAYVFDVASDGSALLADFSAAGPDLDCPKDLGLVIHRGGVGSLRLDRVRTAQMSQPIRVLSAATDIQLDIDGCDLASGGAINGGHIVHHEGGGAVRAYRSTFRDNADADEAHGVMTYCSAHIEGCRFANIAQAGVNALGEFLRVLDSEFESCGRCAITVMARSEIIGCTIDLPSGADGILLQDGRHIIERTFLRGQGRVGLAQDVAHPFAELSAIDCDFAVEGVANVQRAYESEARWTFRRCRFRTEAGVSFSAASAQTAASFLDCWFESGETGLPIDVAGGALRLQRCEFLGARPVTIARDGGPTALTLIDNDFTQVTSMDAGLAVASAGHEVAFNGYGNRFHDDRWPVVGDGVYGSLRFGGGVRDAVVDVDGLTAHPNFEIYRITVPGLAIDNIDMPNGALAAFNGPIQLLFISAGTVITDAGNIVPKTTATRLQASAAGFMYDPQTARWYEV